MGRDVRLAEATQVAIFAKAPLAGTVKTRVAPLLGAEAAAVLHARLVRRTLAAVRTSGLAPVSLWCMPDASHPFFADCAKEFGVSLHVQRGENLGERMARAFEALLATGPALLVGSDCPALGPEELRAAANLLAGRDAVFQPAEDGGYVMVGLTRMVPGIFDGIQWGGRTVMRDTRNVLASSRADWRELPVLWDVDRPEDYVRLIASGLLERSHP